MGQTYSRIFAHLSTQKLARSTAPNLPTPLSLTTFVKLKTTVLALPPSLCTFLIYLYNNSPFGHHFILNILSILQIFRIWKAKLWVWTIVSLTVEPDLIVSKSFIITFTKADMGWQEMLGNGLLQISFIFLKHSLVEVKVMNLDRE
jgi:hypothetical protein